MNRETFMHNVDITDADIITAFESIMALYCLCNIADYENIKISTTSSELASFDVTFDNANYADKVYTMCNKVHIPIYGVFYSISCELDGNTVHITLT